MTCDEHRKIKALIYRGMCPEAIDAIGSCFVQGAFLSNLLGYVTPEGTIYHRLSIQQTSRESAELEHR